MSYNFRNTKVLLVEDNAPMLHLLRGVLQSFGIDTIITSVDGNDAFEKFCKINPDLVITDWMMSPCDGIELGKKIRNDPRSPNRYVPIILMTGFSEKQRVFSSRDAGITEFLVKPFNSRDLYKRIFQIIEKPRVFVECNDFFGPDRRRKRDEKGDKKRRERDKVDKDYSETKAVLFI